MHSSYELIGAFGVPASPFFAYGNGVFINGIEEQQKVVAHIAEVELSLLLSWAFLRAVCVGFVVQLFLRRLTDACDGHGVLMKVPVATV